MAFSVSRIAFGHAQRAGQIGSDKRYCDRRREQQFFAIGTVSRDALTDHHAAGAHFGRLGRHGEQVAQRGGR